MDFYIYGFKMNFISLESHNQKTIVMKYNIRLVLLNIKIILE